MRVRGVGSRGRVRVCRAGDNRAGRRAESGRAVRPAEGVGEHGPEAEAVGDEVGTVPAAVGGPETGGVRVRGAGHRKGARRAAWAAAGVGGLGPEVQSAACAVRATRGVGERSGGRGGRRQGVRCQQQQQQA